MNQCTCKIEWDAEQFWHIVYCPMHKSAGELLEACKAGLDCIEKFGKDFATADFLRHTIARAEGK